MFKPEDFKINTDFSTTSINVSEVILDKCIVKDDALHTVLNDVQRVLNRFLGMQITPDEEMRILTSICNNLNDYVLAGLLLPKPNYSVPTKEKDEFSLYEEIKLEDKSSLLFRRNTDKVHIVQKDEKGEIKGSIIISPLALKYINGAPTLKSGDTTNPQITWEDLRRFLE
jgi:hypothetical protein